MAPPPSPRSRRSLDLLNFFIADVQTGFGPFIAVYLTASKWTQVEIGFALTLGTLTAMLSQVPAGAFVDAIRSKRLAAAGGILAIMGSALLFALHPLTLSVYVAEILHGFASCIISPAIAAISLRLVGHAALGERLGRNARFASIGNGVAAAIMGAVGSYWSSSAVFWLTAALGVPGLIALYYIEPVTREVREVTRRRFSLSGLRHALTNRTLIVFWMAALLFHVSNAALLPLAGTEATKAAGSAANLIIAACIVVPQIMVALISPWVGRVAEERGRRYALVVGWAALPLRGLLMALSPTPFLLIAIQALGGISAATFGVMLPLIAADLTRDSGRFNLCMGVIGLAVFIGASISTALAGWVADVAGDGTAFVALSAAGLLGTALVWFGMPETRPVTLCLRHATLGRAAGR
ncbi:MAG: MFS transporter [Acetobacteraceae bacterium]|nr:MFS transporter [Acetobacteraceae bacterium]